MCEHVNECLENITDKKEIAELCYKCGRLATDNKLLCNDIECHNGIDILRSLWEAINRIPACGLSGILCGAAQEIDALRNNGGKMFTGNEESVFVYAARYAHNRQTGAALQVVNQILSKWDLFREETKAQLKRESDDATCNQEDWVKLRNR